MFKRVVDFFKPPEYDNIERTEKARFLHVALFVFGGACMTLGVLNLSAKSNLDIFLFIFGGLCLLGIPANKKGYYMPVALFVSGLLITLITYSLVEGVGLKDAGLIAYPLYILFSTYLFHKKAVIAVTFLSIVSVIAVYFLEIRGKTNQVEIYLPGKQAIAIVILILGSGFLFWVVVENWERVVQNLREAYDLTLSGWGQALDYRDQGTEGHSQRVVETTLILAKQMGIRGQKLLHIRRGALLHDIGKMAIPDSILLKKGNLSGDEWVIVRQHPVYARNMIEHIPYLKPAMDIPYCHHEKWDGSGYPQGLIKEEIPLAARIFAVVDVWDALTSDRPYRQAWPENEVRNYILDQSGKQFDPKIVNLFMQLLETNSDRSSIEVK